MKFTIQKIEKYKFHFLLVFIILVTLSYTPMSKVEVLEKTTFFKSQDKIKLILEHEKGKESKNLEHRGYSSFYINPKKRTNYNNDGKLKWKKYISNKSPFAPAIYGNTIYFACLQTPLYALNPDGSVKWTYYKRQVQSAPSIGPDGTIYFICSLAGRYNGICALKPDGTEKWVSSIDDLWIYSESIGAVGADGTLYFGWTEFDSEYHNLYAVSPLGELKWKFSTAKEAFKPVYISLCISIGLDGTIYFGSSDHNLYALSPDGNLKWSFPTGDKINPNSVIGTEGNIYFGSDDNYLYCVHPNGTLKWKFLGRFSPAPRIIDSDGILYFGCNDSYFYALNSNSLGLANSSWPKWKHDNKNTACAQQIPDLLRPLLNFSGEKKWHRSLFMQEYINILTWDPNPESEQYTEKYRLYQIEGESQTLVAELNSVNFKYLHRKVEKDKKYYYALTGVDSEGKEGLFTYTIVK